MAMVGPISVCIDASQLSFQVGGLPGGGASRGWGFQVDGLPGGVASRGVVPYPHVISAIAQYRVPRL